MKTSSLKTLGLKITTLIPCISLSCIKAQVKSNIAQGVTALSKHKTPTRKSIKRTPKAHLKKKADFLTFSSSFLVHCCLHKFFCNYKLIVIYYAYTRYVYYLYFYCIIEYTNVRSFYGTWKNDSSSISSLKCFVD